MAEIVKVVYADHSMTFDDYDPTKPFSPEICTVVGFAIAEGMDPAWMHVAAEKVGDGWRATTHIHRASILHVTRLESVGKKP